MTAATATRSPTSWAVTKPGTDDGAMPANVSLKARPTVTAGFANDVDEVHQYAAPMYAPTAQGITVDRPPRTSAKISTTSPAVATTSDSRRVPPLRWCWDQLTSASPYIALARTAPQIAPASCVGMYTPSC